VQFSERRTFYHATIPETCRQVVVVVVVEEEGAAAAAAAVAHPLSRQDVILYLLTYPPPQVSSVFSFLKPFLFMRYVLHIFQSLSFNLGFQPSTCELSFLSP
jgi:hypothetical protein